MKNKYKKISSLIIMGTFLFTQANILNIKAKEYDPQHIQASKKDRSDEIRFRENFELPSKYDLRDYGYVSPVKNQGNIGACWSFATLGSLESCALKKGNKYDFSEIHMSANNDFFRVNIGGNNRVAASYLTSWKGPVLEKDDPYPNPPELYNVKSNKNAKAAFHVQDVIFLPPRKNSLDNKFIKNALMNYGATTATIYYDRKYLNQPHASFYNDETDKINHAILIVGWDDNYSKENFLHKPPQNGAFICKNSYGTSFGKGGYFYISYYDKTIGNDNAVFHSLEPANNYEHIYASQGTYDCSSRRVNFHMEVFNPIDNSKEELAAVSFFSHKRNQTYGIYIEPDYDKNSYNGYFSGKLKKLKTVTYEEGGFHTVKLDTKVELLKDKKFALIVDKEGSSEPRLLGGNKKEKLEDDIQIKPLPKSKDMEISRIYTRDKRYTPVSNISLNKNELNLKKDENFKLISTITPYNATNDKVKWTSDNEQIVKVSQDGNVTGVNIGEAVIKVSSLDGNFEAECRVKVGVDSKLVSITPEPNSVINPESEIRVKFDCKLKSFDPKGISITDENEVQLEKHIYIDGNVLVIKPKKVKNNGGKYITSIYKEAITNIFDRKLEEEYNIQFEHILETSKVNNIKIKDKILEDAIKNKLNVENRNLSTEDMKKLTELTINDNVINSLEGIQYAINLKKLSIKKSNIINLKPISKLYLLEELAIELSKIKDISSMADLTKLKSLTLKNAHIKDITGIRNSSDLSYLDLSGNEIREIGFIGRFYKLQHLDLHNNLISNVSNLEHLKKLNECNLDTNLISRIICIKYMIIDRDQKNRYAIKLNIDNNLINLKNDPFNIKAYGWLKNNIDSCKNLKDEVKYNKIISINNNKFILGDKSILKDNKSIILEFAKDIELVNKNLITLTNQAKENIDIDILCNKNRLIITPKSNYELGNFYNLNFKTGAINSLIINERNAFNGNDEKYDKVPFKEQNINFELTNNIKGDINKDGKIDIKELAIVAEAYGEEVDSIEDKYINIDINEDGIINIYDVTCMANLIK